MTRPYFNFLINEFMLLKHSITPTNHRCPSQLHRCQCVNNSQVFSWCMLQVNISHYPSAADRHSVSLYVVDELLCHNPKCKYNQQLSSWFISYFFITFFKFPFFFLSDGMNSRKHPLWSCLLLSFKRRLFRSNPSSNGAKAQPAAVIKTGSGW